MTTFQEPPLQSRRAVRESERAEATSVAPSRPAGGGEPLNYVTQNRPLLPGYEAPPMRGRRAADPVAPAAPAADPQPEAPAFRVRDYSPEARRAAPAWEVTEDAPGGGVVEYHTQARAAVIPPAAPSMSAPLAAAPSPAAPAHASLASTLNQPSEPSEQTLTRRELRALREAHGISAVPTDATPVVPVVPPPAPSAFAGPPPSDTSPQLASALAEFDALAAGDRSSRSGRRAALQPEAATTNFESLFTLPAQLPDLAQPTAVAPEPTPLLMQPTPMAPAQPAVVPEPDRPAAAVPTPFPSVPSPAAPVLPERPVGHWTNQADLDDRTQASDSTVSRRIGSGGLATSALVLPALPGQDLSTGDIRVTGSISLPHSMSSIGAHPSQVDESDLDHLLDPGDQQVVSTDSIPIRASRAVSSHTSSRAIISAVKPRGNRALTALIISAAGMAAVVVTLLIVALATNVL
jgi:hypothetical protein